MMSTSLQKVTGGASSPTFSNKLHNNFCINDTNQPWDTIACRNTTIVLRMAWNLEMNS